MPQINLAMLFGEKSRLPVFCRTYQGSIHDVSTLEGMIEFIDELNLNQMHFVMDKGFYKKDNIDELLERYIKFAVGVPLTTTLAKKAIQDNRDTIVQPKHAIEVDGDLYYAVTSLKKIANRRAYAHVYYPKFPKH